jgi:hypothetical protein
MATWILNTEADNVSLKRMPSFMQEAIDLSALAQNVERFDQLNAETEIEAEVKKGLATAEEIERAQSQMIEVDEAGVEVGKRKPILVFEQKVLHSIEEKRGQLH